MDPNTLLARIRSLAEKPGDTFSFEDCLDLQNAILALDEMLTRGEPLPDEWCAYNSDTVPCLSFSEPSR